jgi:hypothetical protein
MIIVGLTGAIGSGKTTFGNMLGAQSKHHLHLESSTVIAEVANDLRLHNTYPLPNTADISAVNQWLSTLPKILEDRVHRRVDWDAIKLSGHKIEQQSDNYRKLFEYIDLLQAQPALRSGSITTDNKSTHRALLQWLGGYLAKQVSGDIWYRELIERGLAKGDVDLLTLGGVRFPADAECIWQNHGLIIELQRPSQAIQDAADITERERSLIQPNTIVSNNGTIEQLEATAHRVYADMLTSKTANEYIAAELN